MPDLCHALGWWCYILWPVVADAVVQSLAWWVSDGTEDSVRHSWADWVFPQQAVLPSSSASAADAPLPAKHAVCLYTHIHINILMTWTHAMTSALSYTSHESVYNKLHLIFIQMMNSDWMRHTMANNNIRLHTYPSFSTIWVLNYHHSLSGICKKRSKLTSDTMSIKLLNIFKIQINKNKQICHFLILKRDLHGLQHLNH